MARLKAELLGRVEGLADRVVLVADELERKRVTRRIVDQVLAAGTSVGANVFEADEAMSRADFVKCLGIANKELNETRFWLRLIGRHAWIPPARLEPLIQECEEVRRVLGAIIARTKRVAKAR